MSKVMIDQEEVKRYLHELHITLYSTAKKLGVPVSAVRAIAEGREKPFYYPAPKFKLKQQDKCTCCGFREKAEGLKYLCRKCFQENSGDVGDAEHVVLGE